MADLPGRYQALNSEVNRLKEVSICRVDTDNQYFEMQRLNIILTYFLLKKGKLNNGRSYIFKISDFIVIIYSDIYPVELLLESAYGADLKKKKLYSRI